jgi:hypothetical protein
LCYQSGSTEASVIALGTGGGGGTGTITALNNQTANRLVTIGSTTTELDGEANLTYDGTTFTVNDDMQVSSGKLTVDGEITSSEAIFAKGTELDFSISASANTHLIISGANNEVMIGTENASGKLLTVAGDISASGDLILEGHITASGNISSSGNISANQLLDITRLTFDTDSYIDSHVGGIFTSGHITASGNISASAASTGSFGQINTTHGFDDGYHGNDEFIPLLPFDFYLSDDNSRSHGVYTDDNGATARGLNASKNHYATKIIPKGFKATAVRVNCSATTTNSVTPYDGSIANGSVTAHTAGNTNADIDLDSQVDGTGETYIVVKFDPGATSDEIQGGKIYITRQ